MQWWWQAAIGELAARLQAAATPQDKRAIMREVAMDWDGQLERSIRRLAATEPAVATHLREVDNARIDGLAAMIEILRPEVEDPKSLAFIQYAAVVGGQWLLDSKDDHRIAGISKTGNALFGLD